MHAYRKAIADRRKIMPPNVIFGFYKLCYSPRSIPLIGVQLHMMSICVLFGPFRFHLGNKQMPVGYWFIYWWARSIIPVLLIKYRAQ